MCAVACGAMCMTATPSSADIAIGNRLPLADQQRKYRVIGSRDPTFPVGSFASLADLSRNGEALAIDKSQCT